MISCLREINIQTGGHKRPNAYAKRCAFSMGPSNVTRVPRRCVYIYKSILRRTPES